MKVTPRVRRLTRRFFYWLGFKRFRNGRFTREELLVRATQQSQRLWDMILDGAASFDDLEEHANLGWWIRFLERDANV